MTIDSSKEIILLMIVTRSLCNSFACLNLHDLLLLVAEEKLFYLTENNFNLLIDLKTYYVCF